MLLTESLRNRLPHQVSYFQYVFLLIRIDPFNHHQCHLVLFLTLRLLLFLSRFHVKVFISLKFLEVLLDFQLCVKRYPTFSSFEGCPIFSFLCYVIKTLQKCMNYFMNAS